MTYRGNLLCFLIRRLEDNLTHHPNNDVSGINIGTNIAADKHCQFLHILSTRAFQNVSH